MKIYYLHDGQSQQGPYSLEELKALGITASTHVWFKDLSEWKLAKDIDALQSLFNQPPPFKENFQRAHGTTFYKPTKTPKKRIGLWIGLLVFLLVVFLLGYNMMHANDFGNYKSRNSTHYNEPPPSTLTPEELRNELLRKERSDFLRYLKFTSATMEPNMVVTRTGSFWRTERKEQQGFILHGAVRNSATLASYKDLVFSITYQTETKTAIKTENLTVYQYFKKGNATAFDLVVHPPAEMKFFAVEVVGAVAVN